jgi:hypothetical protein
MTLSIPVLAYCPVKIRSRIMRWAGHVAYMEKERDPFSILVGKFEEITLRKPRR